MCKKMPIHIEIIYFVVFLHTNKHISCVAQQIMAKKFEIRNSTAEFLTFGAEGKVS